MTRDQLIELITLLKKVIAFIQFRQMSEHDQEQSRQLASEAETNLTKVYNTLFDSNHDVSSLDKMNISQVGNTLKKLILLINQNYVTDNQQAKVMIEQSYDKLLQFFIEMISYISGQVSPSFLSGGLTSKDIKSAGELLMLISDVQRIRKDNPLNQPFTNYSEQLNKLLAELLKMKANRHASDIDIFLKNISHRRYSLSPLKKEYFMTYLKKLSTIEHINNLLVKHCQETQDRLSEAAIGRSIISTHFNLSRCYMTLGLSYQDNNLINLAHSHLQKTWDATVPLKTLLLFSQFPNEARFSLHTVFSTQLAIIKQYLLNYVEQKQTNQGESHFDLKIALNMLEQLKIGTIPYFTPPGGISLIMNQIKFEIDFLVLYCLVELNQRIYTPNLSYFLQCIGRFESDFLDAVNSKLAFSHKSFYQTVNPALFLQKTARLINAIYLDRNEHTAIDGMLSMSDSLVESQTMNESEASSKRKRDEDISSSQTDNPDKEQKRARISIGNLLDTARESRSRPIVSFNETQHREQTDLLLASFNTSAATDKDNKFEEFLFARSLADTEYSNQDFISLLFNHILRAPLSAIHYALALHIHGDINLDTEQVFLLMHRESFLLHLNYTLPKLPEEESQQNWMVSMLESRFTIDDREEFFKQFIAIYNTSVTVLPHNLFLTALFDSFANATRSMIRYALKLEACGKITLTASQFKKLDEFEVAKPINVNVNPSESSAPQARDPMLIENIMQFTPKSLQGTSSGLYWNQNMKAVNKKWETKKEIAALMKQGEKALNEDRFLDAVSFNQQAIELYGIPSKADDFKKVGDLYYNSAECYVDLFMTVKANERQNYYDQAIEGFKTAITYYEKAKESQLSAGKVAKAYIRHVGKTCIRINDVLHDYLLAYQNHELNNINVEDCLELLMFLHQQNASIETETDCKELLAKNLNLMKDCIEQEHGEDSLMGSDLKEQVDQLYQEFGLENSARILFV